MFKNFFADFFAGKLLKWLIGSCGTAVALFLLGKNAFGLSVFRSVLLGIAVLTFLILLSFIRYLIVNTNRTSAYGEAIIMLKNGFAGINLLKRNDTNNSEEIMSVLVEMCDTLKLVFDRLLRVDCSVSIKLPTRNEPISNNTIVENVCRDESHYIVRTTEVYKNQVHRVTGNTAYNVILENVLNGDRNNFYYLNNNVLKTRDYLTTSRPAYPNGLPYKSELVYPILPLYPTEGQRSEAGKHQYEIWGFLCIDCNHINKFNSRYHVAIIEGVADGVFDVIMKINRSKPSNN
ncbi:MAG: hypothetical protein JNK14_01165 [Chitinophagaceae bacterium]|nr:hypothetical protein [Chitinophagaceae bacterium]